MNRGRTLGAGRLWKRGANWVLDYRDEHSVRRRQQLGTNKREAEGLQAEIVAKRNRRLLGLESGPKDIALADLRDRYLDDLETRATARHVLNVTGQLVRLLDELPATTVRELTASDFLEFRARLLKAGRSNRCANVQTQALKGMLRWAVAVDLIDVNPLAKIRPLPTGRKHETRPRRALSDDEIERFMACAYLYDHEWGAAKPRVPQAPFWRTLLDTGARYGEARQLTWADLDEQGAALHFRAVTTKSGQARTIPINVAHLVELQELRNVQWKILGCRPTAGEPIFVSPRGKPLSASTNNARRIFDQILERAEIEPVDEHGNVVVIHSLRHSFISRLQRRGVPLAHAQVLAGHSDPRLTASIYTHLDQADLRSAVESFAPVTPPPKSTGTDS